MVILALSIQAGWVRTLQDALLLSPWRVPNEDRHPPAVKYLRWIGCNAGLVVGSSLSRYLIIFVPLVSLAPLAYVFYSVGKHLKTRECFLN